MYAATTGKAEPYPPKPIIMSGLILIILIKEYITPIKEAMIKTGKRINDVNLHALICLNS